MLCSMSGVACTMRSLRVERWPRRWQQKRLGEQRRRRRREAAGTHRGTHKCGHGQGADRHTLDCHSFERATVYALPAGVFSSFGRWSNSSSSSSASQFMKSLYAFQASNIKIQYTGYSSSREEPIQASAPRTLSRINVSIWGCQNDARSGKFQERSVCGFFVIVLVLGVGVHVGKGWSAASRVVNSDDSSW